MLALIVAERKIYICLDFQKEPHYGNVTMCRTNRYFLYFASVSQNKTWLLNYLQWKISARVYFVIILTILWHEPHDSTEQFGWKVLSPLVPTIPGAWLSVSFATLFFFHVCRDFGRCHFACAVGTCCKKKIPKRWTNTYNQFGEGLRFQPRISLDGAAFHKRHRFNLASFRSPGSSLSRSPKGTK